MEKKVESVEREVTGAGVIVMMLLAIVIAITTGCSGVELRGAMGLHRVDEHQSSQRTYARPVPWKCYFTNCNAAEESHGS